MMKAGVVSSDLFEYALIRPLLVAEQPSSLKIVSGYATHAMATRHIIEVRNRKKSLDVDLVYGMAGYEGVSKANHLGFLSLEAQREFRFTGSFQCSYVKRPQSVHSKVYVWCRGGHPVKAFIGSANYTENGFAVPSRIETLAECDPESALAFFNAIRKGAISCHAANREKDFLPKVHMSQNDVHNSSVISIEQDRSSPYYGYEKVTLSLLTRRGDAGNGSRLNWGVRPDGNPRESRNAGGKISRRNPNQAYIGLPSNIQRIGFFPDVKRRFTVLTDDNKVFSCVRAQSNGKGIETPQDNSEIGRYFRERLGLRSGAYISVRDLRRYGRFDVTFYKQDDETFIMDFSRP